MKTIGQTLQQQREKLHKTIDDVHATTLIAREYIEAIEQNKFTQLPNPAAVYGFVGSYAQSIGLERENILAMLRRDYAAKEHVKNSRTVLLAKRQQRRRLSPVVGLLGIAVVVFTLYGLLMLSQLSKPPRLTLTTPKEDDSVFSPVFIRGQTESDASVFIDEVPVAVTQDGEFALELELPAGKRTITAVARNRKGKERIEQVTFMVGEQ